VVGEDLLQLVRVPLVCVSSSVSACIRSDFRVCSHNASCLVELYFSCKLCVHLREKDKDKDKDKERNRIYAFFWGMMCVLI
jgi:hypothetical protein